MIDVNNATALLMDTLQMAVDETVIRAAEAFPGLVAAIIIFLIGWVFAVILSRLFSGMLKAIRLESFLKEHKLEDAIGTVKLSDVLVKLLKYYVLLLFLQAAVDLVDLGTLTSFMSSLLSYAPVLIGASLVLLISVILGEYLKEVIKELSKSPLVKLIARLTKLLVIYVGATMALETMGIRASILNELFTIIVAAIAFGISLAVGIAFGLGGQDEAKDIIKKSRKHLKI